MSKKKIGYLGGSFDPIHLGHLNLAIEAIERIELDEVWFCPTVQSPHKRGAPPIAIKHRLKMVELALQGNPKFKLIQNEALKEEAPYTYDTLLDLKQDPQNQDKIFYLLLSEDLLPSLHTWHKVEALLEEFPFFVGSRKYSKHLDTNALNKFILEKVKNKIEGIRTLEISSRNLRDRLKNKLYCAHLMPLKVLDYIYQNELY